LNKPLFSTTCDWQLWVKVSPNQWHLCLNFLSQILRQLNDHVLGFQIVPQNPHLKPCPNFSHILVFYGSILTDLSMDPFCKAQTKFNVAFAIVVVRMEMSCSRLWCICVRVSLRIYLPVKLRMLIREKGLGENLFLTLLYNNILCFSCRVHCLAPCFVLSYSNFSNRTLKKYLYEGITQIFSIL
jgi:hypothetical protein